METQMSVFETIVAIAPAVGLALAVRLWRRDSLASAGVVLLVSIGFASAWAIEGNRRPIAGLIAFGFLFLAVLAGEKQKGDALALAFFCAAFLTLMITSLYT